jgi:hypothetical protein
MSIATVQFTYGYKRIHRDDYDELVDQKLYNLLHRYRLPYDPDMLIYRWANVIEVKGMKIVVETWQCHINTTNDMYADTYDYSKD